MKFISVITLALCAFAFAGCDFTSSSEAANRARDSTTKISNTSQNVVPVPTVSYFAERRTIAAWSKHWDGPDKACYVYLFIPGVEKSIGYYVSRGKPASTQSYLTPGNIVSSSTGYTHEVPDIDGCYGDNNKGIRFFTASGIAVEFAGNVSYIYSDKPLPMNVPLLGE